MREQDILKQIQIGLSKIKSRFFRNNTGTGWVGQTFRAPRDMVYGLKSGDIVISNPRPLNAGLCLGSSDLIGWHPIKITHEHVGKTLAIFAAVEVKRPAGKPTKEQTAFLNAVKTSGGIAILAHSLEETLRGIDDWGTP